jgi:hypothetical protein
MKRFIIFSNIVAKELNSQLEGWLAGAELTHGPARALIVP